ncbi:DUF4237 domain-containing protein [Flavobacterium bomense]|uniref:DUF4237 domain-containing protein n=1 Tax=Flavobacterium bomense TaxID=2497483 RepID=A0A3S0MZA3_9FLAO|nr:DUF4237 domain-containing protein [Flavobacterium bomense]
MEFRALSPNNSTTLNSYEVLRTFTVQKSFIAPPFGKIGTGVQYHSQFLNANDLVKGDFLRLNK